MIHMVILYGAAAVRGDMHATGVDVFLVDAATYLVDYVQAAVHVVGGAAPVNASDPSPIRVIRVTSREPAVLLHVDEPVLRFRLRKAACAHHFTC